MILDERVDRLEVIVTQISAAVLRLERNVDRLEIGIEEMRRQAELDRAESARMRQQFELDRAESARTRQQSEKERRELARQLGDISIRMGTIVEDMIAPSLRRLAAEELGCGEEVFYAMRSWRTRADGQARREFDAFFVGTQAVMLNETKTTARPEYATAFIEFLRDWEFALYFPEYANKPMVPVFSSLHIPPDLVAYLTKHNIYAVAMSDDTMRVLNLEQVRAQSN